MEFTVVHRGIDSLYISYRGSLQYGLIDDLESRKKLARSPDLEEQAKAVLPLGEHRFEVKDKGSGVFSYVLIDNWFRISVAGAGSNKLPALYVQVSSELLNCRGVDASMDRLRTIVRQLLQANYEEKLSRADIFIDFVTNADFEDISVESWISPARRIHEFWAGNDFTGWSIGNGGNISARLYDKTIEIGVSRKEWFKEIWGKQGWQDGQRVLRLEFEIKRVFLSQTSIENVNDLLNKMNDLWRFCTHDWLRLAVDNGAANKCRWDTAPVWCEIQKATFNDNGYTEINRVVNLCRTSDMKRLYLNGLGYLITYAAICGYKGSNLAAAAQSFLRDAGEFLDAYVCSDKKVKERFSDSLDYVEKKINLKKKQFNKP